MSFTLIILYPFFYQNLDITFFCNFPSIKKTKLFSPIQLKFVMNVRILSISFQLFIFKWEDNA